MKTAVIHEWFEKLAGSERVVEQFLHVFPGADLYALVDFLPSEDRSCLCGRAVNTSFLQRLPLAKRLFRHFLPLMPMAIEQFDLHDYDVICSSNHAVAKGVLTRPDQLHICYIHTPIRYAWDMVHEYLGPAHGPKTTLARAVLHYMRLWDRLAADRVDRFLANSHYVAARVRKTYRRPAEVIYPPVDVDRFPLCEQKDDFYLVASRMAPYKRMDQIVRAFSRMPHRRLVVIGDGSEYPNISKLAGPNVELLGFQPDDVLCDHMQRARAFVFAAEEDFGILPVEAQACGTPVIAFGRGGARETVLEGTTGLFFHEQSPDAIAQAVDAFEAQQRQFVPEVIRKHAEQFHVDRFRREIFEYVDAQWQAFQGSTETQLPLREFAIPH